MKNRIGKSIFWIIPLAAYASALVLNAMGYSIWLPSCPIYTYTGMECFGCGMNRAIIALLQGEWREAYGYNAYLIWYLLAGIFIILYIFKQHKPNTV